MNGNNNVPQGNNREGTGEETDREESSDLGIKRVRTFAEDLAEARLRAGVTDEIPKKRRGFFGQSRVKETPPPPQPEPTKVLEAVSIPKDAPRAKTEPTQPTREAIEQELAKSGIIAEPSPNTETEEKKIEESSVPVIRTYKYDTAESVKSGVSKISIVAREAERRARLKDFSEPVEEHAPLYNVMLIGLSVMFVLVGSFGGWYFYRKSMGENEPSATQTSGTTIFVNAERNIVLGDLTGEAFLARLQEERGAVVGKNNTMTGFVFTKGGNEEGVSVTDVLNRIPNIPPRLIRTLDNYYAIGVHHMNEAKEPFILLKVNDFNIAFDAMLEWEHRMNASLSPFFRDTRAGKQFQDALIQNKDVRALYDSRGNITLLYAFPNTETLIITTNSDTFFELFKRLSASNATRN